MNNYTRLVLILMILLFEPHTARAEDVYVLFNYPEKSEVHLVYARYGPSSPYGRIFSAPPASDFFIDEQGRFRLLYTSRVNTFKTADKSLFRQVFDGLPVLADSGRQGYAQHQDQRDTLIAGHAGRPVFRSRGAPFSPGPGFMVSQAVAMPGLEKGETDILPDKNWYELPNASWYQTWFKEVDAGHSSYMIYYDCWEQREVLLYDSVWSGFPVAKTDDVKIGSVYDYRLRRAIIDGAMELIANRPQPEVVLKLISQIAFSRNPEVNAQPLTTIYSWYNNAPGKLSTPGWAPDLHMAEESRHQQRRIPAQLDSGRLLVMGTDILHAWLGAGGLSPAGSECSLCAGVPAGAGRHAILVYSAPDNAIYRFYLNDENVVDFKQTGRFTPAFAPVSMTGDNDGNLMIGGFSTWPEELNSPESLLMSVEAIDLIPSSSDADTTRGTILLAQQHYFNLYRLSPDSGETVWLSRINVGRHLYQCDFSIAQQAQALTSDVRELLRLAQQPGNHLSLPVRLDEERQPGQFIMPDQVMLALSK
ncbi:MAG: hypothetical protein GQF41_1015 [Candidatus Rifleibacterium amylolyticum]|nr:MAG: hypothetical protein GQF41_1015 [Candidatus Rifleibacterium amylolyticum]